MKAEAIEAVDLFCGAGGTSTGILKAADHILRRPIQLTAVNHWRVAVNTHELNHPRVKHLCENVENVHPRDLIRSGNLHLLAASTECRFHSNARGGGPWNEQSRSQPWQLIRWATDVRVENILMENVREFLNWGPLHRQTKRPIQSRKGEFFRAFINALANLGYTVEYKVQVAANYGDPTSRERLMLIARKGRPVAWPAATHGPGRALPWKSARECIDWSLKGKSLFHRRKPLCANTLARIAAGLKKFGGAAAEPFLVLLNGGTNGHICASARSLDAPMPTVVAGGNHLALVQPFVIGQQTCAAARSVDSPMPTIATAGAIQLVEPIIVQTDQTGGNGLCARPVSAPAATIVSKQNMILVEPLVLKYYKTGRCKSVDEPMDTITTKPRFLLVEFEGGPGIAERDILVRMVQPHELARCHSFPGDYRFLGTQKDQTKQIGNSVPVELAAAHAAAALS